jgi:hypothetical protein
MLIEYKENTCNIKNCENSQENYFICKEHLEKYAYNDKLIETLKRQKRIILGNPNRKDKIYYKLYYLLHYSTGIHVKFIEHFPNETIFLFNLPKVYRRKNKKFTTEEFIADFDFSENYEIDSLKVQFSKSKFKEPLIEYSESKLKVFLLKYYLIAFISFSLILLIINQFSFKSLINKIFLQLTLVYFLSYFIVKRGIIFFNKSKDLIKLALENNLYKSKKDNKDFILESHTTLRKVKSMEENKYIYYGNLISLFIFCVGYFSYQNYINNYSIASTLINIPLIICVFFMSIILFSFIWNNRFIIPLVRRIRNKNIKFNIYSYKKDLGISILKDFLKTLSNYNLVIILTFFTLQYFFRLLEIYPIISFVILLLIGWNISSYIFIFKIRSFLKKQFRNEIKLEREKLEKSNTNAVGFEKYKFLDELKFELFPIKKILLRIFNLTYPFVISYFIMKHDEYIFKIINELMEYIKGV